MYDYELYEILTFDLLETLVEENGNKCKNREVCESSQRENLIVQKLKDELNLEINKDDRFTNIREVFFYRIICLNEDEEVVAQNIYPSKNPTNLFFEIKDEKNQAIKYKIFIKEQEVRVSRKMLEDDVSKKNQGDEISLKLEKTRTNDSNSNKSTYSRSSRNDKKFIYFRKKFLDRNRTIKIEHTKHEVDGNLKVKNKIVNMEKILGDYLYYPPKSNNINLDQGEQILIEVKQNTNFDILLEQMEKVMKDFTSLFPKEKYNYFGFINEVNTNHGSNNEKELLDNIEKIVKENPNFKIFLFVIKNNKFLTLSLNDQVDYPTHYYNLYEKKMAEMKKEIGEMKTEMKTEIRNMKMEIMEGVKNEIKNLRKNFGKQ